MKILLICPYMPYPPTDGGKVRVLNLMKKLHRRNNITLIGYAKDKREETGIKALIPYCKKVIAINRRPRLSIFNVVKYLTSFYPATYILNGFSSALSRIIREELQREKYDLIQVEHFYAAEPALKAAGKDIPKLLIEHNIEYMIFGEYAKYERNILKKLFYIIDRWRMQRTETRIWSRFDSVVFMSPEEEAVYKKKYPAKRSFVVPNGADVERYPHLTSSASRPTLVLLANFKYKANADALRYFINDIFPLIKDRHPSIKFDVIGNDPHGVAARYTTQGIKIHGYVKDPEKYLNGGNIFIAPIRIGGGIKLKVLEAMAAGMAVVGTTESFAGIEGEAGKDYFVADTPAMFASSVSMLINDPALRIQTGKNARDLVKKMYNWDMLAEKMQRIYDDVGGVK